MKTSTLASAIKRKFTHMIGKHFLRLVSSVQAHCSVVATTPLLPNETFTWVSELEAKYQDITTEFETVWKDPNKIPAFHQLSPDQARISKKDHWKTYAFFIFGNSVIGNCEQCEKTTAALLKIPNLQNAWFSILAPNYHIPPHRGPTKALIRCHLGLKVPSKADDCWLRVDNEVTSWEEGKCLLFDDTYEHEVQNNTNEYRAVLFIDVNRPMNRTGTLINSIILNLMQATHYVKEPLNNIKKWNQNLANQSESDS